MAQDLATDMISGLPSYGASSTFSGEPVTTSRSVSSVSSQTSKGNPDFCLASLIATMPDFFTSERAKRLLEQERLDLDDVQGEVDYASILDVSAKSPPSIAWAIRTPAYEKATRSHETCVEAFALDFDGDDDDQHNQGGSKQSK